MNKENLTFSVIMPCYNSERYVRGAVQSILNQTWPNWELVAVNDGSKDGTLAILEEFAAADHRVRIFSKENGGYVSAVNHGLEHITGDYFLMMGSDDALAPDLFENLVNAMTDGIPDCIAFRTEIIQDGQNLGVEKVTQFPESVSRFDTTLAAFEEEYPLQAQILFTRDTSKCYKRSLLGDLRYFGRYGFDADGIFSMLLCHNATSFQAVTVTGYYWTLRSDSLSGRKTFFAQDCDRAEIWVRFFRTLLEKNVKLAATEKQYLQYLIGVLRPVCRQGGDPELMKEAGRVIFAVAEREQEDLDLSRKDRLLLQHPQVWKLLDRIMK